MEQLKSSIKTYGLIEPIVVRKIGDDKYEVVCGGRRHYACKSLGMEEIECVVREYTSDEEILDINFMENYARHDLTPIEEAEVYLQRVKMMKGYPEGNEEILYFGGDDKHIIELSKLYSITSLTISNRLKLLFLPETLQNAIESEEEKIHLPASTAIEFFGLTKIEDKKIRNNELHSLYNLYISDKTKMDSITIDKLVDEKMEVYKEGRDKQQKVLVEKIKDLKKKLWDTRIAERETLLDLAQLLIDIQDSETLKDIELPEISFDINLEAEDILEHIEDVEVKEQAIEMLKDLEKIGEVYSNPELWTKNEIRISELNSKLIDIKLLRDRVKQDLITICPFCQAGIDLGIIKELEANHNAELITLQKLSTHTMEINKTITDKIQEIKQIFIILKTKKEFNEKFEKEIKELETPEEPAEIDLEDEGTLLKDAITDYQTETGVKKVNTNTKKFAQFFEEWKKSK